MTFLITFIIFAACIFFMALGLFFFKRPLKKGCSLGIDCECKSQGKNPGTESCKDNKD